jgi:hypothetical protein
MPMLSESMITTGVLLGTLKPVERWQAMRDFDHSNSNFMLDRSFILIGVAAIVVLIIVLCLVSYRQRKRESKGVPSAFNSFARRSGLSAEEQNLALLLADMAEFKQPDMILVSTAAFDKGAAALLAQKSDGNEQKELVTKLSLLRGKLGFATQEAVSQASLVRSSHASSRQIPIGKILQITRRKTPVAVRMETRLIRTDDLEFTVELPEVLKIVPGEVWNLQYNFGQSVWEFDARLLKADGQELTFGHSDDVRFISRRRFLRVEVHKEAYIARFGFAGGEKIGVPQFVHGTLCEIAGPGLLIEAPLQVKNGERVLVVVQAADDKVVQDIGEVRHIKPAEKGYAIAIELTEVKEANVDELVRLTNAAATASRMREPARVR